MSNLTEFYAKLDSDETLIISKIRNVVLTSLQTYALDAGFFQLMPILMSPITDPLNHAVYPAEIKYEERPLKLTASMIFHKQLSLRAKGMERIFIVAPNIRLEKSSIKDSSNHLLEFSQFDLEIKNATMYDVIEFLDGLCKYVFAQVKIQCAEELQKLNRTLPETTERYPVYSSDELKEKYGDKFETIISQEALTPVFVTNYTREFYDRETTPGKPGQYSNFDMIYPEGYGEALSGAEREFEYNQIVYRMNQLGMDLTPFSNYLQAAKDGQIPSTAGAGIGIERLIKFICGKHEIRDVQLFDRSVATEFVF